MEFFVEFFQLRLELSVLIFQFDVLNLDSHFFLRCLFGDGKHFVDFCLVLFNSNAIGVVRSSILNHTAIGLFFNKLEIRLLYLCYLIPKRADGFVEGKDLLSVLLFSFEQILLEFLDKLLVHSAVFVEHKFLPMPDEHLVFLEQFSI